MGLDITERVWQVGLPELSGFIQPTIIASRERYKDKNTGFSYIEDRPIPQRVEMLAKRINAWINLQKKPDETKKIAVIYYNYHPGKNNIGASYLNVLPESLFNIYKTLGDSNYKTDKNIEKQKIFNDIHNYGRNIGNWAPAEIERLVESGKPVMIPLEQYKKWFNEFSVKFRDEVIQKWGKPEDSKIMTWKDNKTGKMFIILPAVQYGNIVFTPQPSRGMEQDIKKLYHDMTTPPHHQYIAFYLWLQKGFKADAVIHIGRHGTHEWLPSKEVGLSDNDSPEALIDYLPNIYPYIVDGVGEGLQSKRKGMAVIIDHLTPPFDKAGLNNELREILGIIEEYNISLDKSPLLAEAKRQEVEALSKKNGILTDLSLDEIKTKNDMKLLEHHIKNVDEKKTPFGLHNKLSFNLWGCETVRHEGVMESQIMYLMRIKPRWDKRGVVRGVEAISQTELKRARIDVTIIPIGLYRDLFPNLMELLDEAVSLAATQDEADNNIKKNIDETMKILQKKGMNEETAKKLATVRIFSVPSGAYGTNLNNLIPMSNTWDKESQLTDVFFNRMGHVYGQGYRGEKITNQDGNSTEDISMTLFKGSLKGSKIAIHSRSGNLYASLDNDDFFQYLGGTAIAIRQLDGKTPEVYVTNMTNPKKAVQETLQKYMGIEMRSRYLNPSWINEMMNEGYAEARYIDKVVEHLWGWQVTTPEIIDRAKWDAMYETYVLDKNGLEIKEKFRKANNMHAYKSIVARMLETVRKGYWKPDKDVIENLSREYAGAAVEVGLACCDHTCNNPMLSDFTVTNLMAAPGLEALVKKFQDEMARMKDKNMPPSPLMDVKKPVEIKPSEKSGSDDKNKIDDAKKQDNAQKDEKTEKVPDKQLKGYEMEEVNKQETSESAPIPYIYIIGFLLMIAVFYAGWRRK